jgi:hypothetical protein
VIGKIHGPASKMIASLQTIWRHEKTLKVHDRWKIATAMTWQ